jgi:hypothetical protein
MSITSMNFPDLLGTFVGFVLTLLVFSYIIGDNTIFRLVIHIFIGVAAGFVALMALENVLWPQLLLPVFQESETGSLVRLIPVILALLLLTKVSTRLWFLGTPVMAYLVGVGAATAVGGAVLGTIFPQIGAAVDMFDLQLASQSGENLVSVFLSGSIAVIGTVSTLAYFHFGAHRKDVRSNQRSPWIEWIAWIGQAFMAMTFGAIFAGVYAAALTALIERLNYLVMFIMSFFLMQS